MRNAKGIAGLIVTAVFYLLGFLMSLADRGEFGDLAIWGGLSLILAAFILFVRSRPDNAMQTMTVRQYNLSQIV